MDGLKHCGSVNVNSPRGVNEKRIEDEAIIQALTADKASLAVVQAVDYALMEKGGEIWLMRMRKE